LYLPSLQLAHASRGQPSSTLQQRIDTLLMLDEEREKDKVNFSILALVFSTFFSFLENLDIDEFNIFWDIMHMGIINVFSFS
jgi:hypothetical protein